ncbi:MAG: ATP-binding protein [Actinomycetota bacterium]
MRDFNFDSRLFLIAGCPLVALALLSGGALSAASGSGEPTAALQALGIIGLVCLVVGLLILLVIGPRISGESPTEEQEEDDDVRLVPHELETVVQAAETLANDRLPALVKAVGDAAETETPTPFDLDLPEGPHSRLAELLNDIQNSAHRAVAVQHEAIQGRLGDLVVNLVRRNQSLLDRQLESIDELETSEENPTRLEQLYGLDLLATRMRRNAESLLVLAGSEPPRRRNGPVSTSDIVRVAVSEIENYRQVSFSGLDDGVVVPGAVVDVAHLLSELLENATSFSPPDSTVTVDGRRTDDGYEITVSDSGIGLSPDQAEQFNRVLASPPGLSFDMSRSLGLMVVGRLAQRHNIDVALTPGSPMGTTATVILPTSLLSEQTTPEPVDANGIADTSEEEASALPLAVRGQEAPDALAADESDSAPEPAAAAKPEAGSSDALARLLGLPTSDEAVATVTTVTSTPAPDTATTTADEDAPSTEGSTPDRRGAAADATATDAEAGTTEDAGSTTAVTASTDDATTADAKTADENGAADESEQPEAAAADESEQPEAAAADEPTAKPAARKTPARKATKRPAKRATKRPSKAAADGDDDGDHITAAPARKQTRKGSGKRRPAAKKGTARKQPARRDTSTTDDQPAEEKQPTAAEPASTPTADSTPDSTASPAATAATAATAEAASEPVEAAAETAAVAEERPETLEDAVPSGAKFDSAIENLLDPEIKIAPRANKGPSGLKRRDRSKSYAPEREGREIPETATATPAATASSRKPEEIRSLLSTYRTARKKPIDDAAAESTDAVSDENGAES